MFKNKSIRKLVFILLWLIIWQGISLVVNNPLIFVGPLETFVSLVSNISTLYFWKTAGLTALRVIFGFLLALCLGVLLGFFAFRLSAVAEFLSPLVSVLKAVPVASFVILVLIAWGSSGLTLTIVLAVVFPIIYHSTLQGLRSADARLVEMTKVFSTRAINKLKFVYRPALAPFLISSCKSAIGMAWKSGVAAEVIGVPLFSIGERLYLSKISLETADLFAWTAVVIFLCYISERLIMFCLNKILGVGSEVQNNG